MNTARKLDRDSIPVMLPAGSFVVQEAPPATVSQKTCERWFGLTSEAFLAMARERCFAVTKRGHLRLAAYDDVKRALLERREWLERRTRTTEDDVSDDDLMNQLGGKR